jgi:hypothetical protein
MAKMNAAAWFVKRNKNQTIPDKRNPINPTSATTADTAQPAGLAHRMAIARATRSSSKARANWIA